MEVLPVKNLNTITVTFIFFVLLLFLIYISIKILDQKKISSLLLKFPYLKKSILLYPKYFITIRFILYIFFLLLSFGSLLNPSFEEEKLTDNLNLKGVDIVFVIDVSLSMNAEDNGVTRLSRVKESILSVLPDLSGNRFGIITFAGAPFLYCPMTSDPGAFSDYVRGLETDMIPDTGTNIKKAFEKASELLKSSKVYRNRIVVLITDGEDIYETMPSNIQSATLLIFGIGSSEGSFIRYKDESTGLSGFVTKEGKLSGDPSDTMLIRSTQNEVFLKKIASSFSGDYINLTKYPGGAEEIISKIRDMEKNTDKVLRDISKKDGYQYLLIPALIFFLLDISLLEIYAGNRKR